MSIRERLAKENPASIQIQVALSGSHYNLGNVHNAMGHLDQALESYGRALTIQERRAREDPTDVDYAMGMAACHEGIGLVQRKMGHREQALDVVQPR